MQLAHGSGVSLVAPCSSHVRHFIPRHGACQAPKLRQARTLRRCPVASAQGAESNGTAGSESSLRIDLSAFPNCEFFKVEAILRPWRLSDVIHDLSANGILGMTATHVLGAGVQGGTRERYRGTEHGLDNLVEKSKLEVVCFRTQVNHVVRIITSAAGTGHVGDGKIFVTPVADIVRIRTEETGAHAERMEGGMSDSNILSSLDR